MKRKRGGQLLGELLQPGTEVAMAVALMQTALCHLCSDSSLRQGRGPQKSLCMVQVRLWWWREGAEGV